MNLNSSFIHRYTTTFPEIPPSVINDAICHQPPSNGIRVNQSARKTRQVIYPSPLQWDTFTSQHIPPQEFVNMRVITNAASSSLVSLQQFFHTINSMPSSSLHSLRDLTSLTTTSQTSSLSEQSSAPKTLSKEEKKAQLQERRRAKAEKKQQKKRTRELDSRNIDPDEGSSDEEEINTSIYRSSLVSAMPWNPENGFFVQHKINYNIDPLYHLSGLYYSQDPSSQLLHPALSQSFAYQSLSHHAIPPSSSHALLPSHHQLTMQHSFDNNFASTLPTGSLQLLDLCASPGGKSLLVADLFSPVHRQSILISNEFDSIRAQTLIENILRSGVVNNIVTLSSGQSLATIFNTPLSSSLLDSIFVQPTCSQQEIPQQTFSLFNHILLDAPCSSSGMMRKQPTIMKTWSKTRIPPIVQVQKELLQSASKLLSSHQITNNIIYMTCAMEADENVRNIQYFLDVANAKVAKLYAQFFDTSNDAEKSSKLQAQIEKADQSSSINSQQQQQQQQQSQKPYTYSAFKSLLSPFHSHFKRWNLYQHQQTNTAQQTNTFSALQYEYHKLLKKIDSHQLPFSPKRLTTSGLVAEYTDLASLYQTLTAATKPSSMDLAKENFWVSESSYAACFVVPYTNPPSVPTRFDQLGEGMFISVLKRINIKAAIRSFIQARLLTKLTTKYNQIQIQLRMRQSTSGNNTADEALSPSSQSLVDLFESGQSIVPHPSQFSSPTATDSSSSLQFKHIGELTTTTQYSFLPQFVQDKLFDSWFDRHHVRNNGYVLLSRGPRFVTPETGFADFYQNDNSNNNNNNNNNNDTTEKDRQYLFSEVILFPKSQLRTLLLLDSIDSYYKTIQSQGSTSTQKYRKFDSQTQQHVPTNSSQRTVVSKSKHLVQSAGLPLGFLSIALNKERDVINNNDHSTKLEDSHINNISFKPSHFLATTPSLLNSSKRSHLFQADRPAAMSLLTTKPYPTTITSDADVQVLDQLIPSSLQHHIKTHSTYPDQSVQVITQNPPNWMNPELNLVSLHLIKSMLQIQYYAIKKQYKTLFESLTKIDNHNDMVYQGNSPKLAHLERFLLNIPHLVANLVVLQEHIVQTSHPIISNSSISPPNPTLIQTDSLQHFQDSLESLTSVRWNPLINAFFQKVGMKMDGGEDSHDLAAAVVTGKYTKYILQKHYQLLDIENQSLHGNTDHRARLRLMEPRSTISIEECLQFDEMKQLMVQLLALTTFEPPFSIGLLQPGDLGDNSQLALLERIDQFFKAISANKNIPLTSIHPLPLPHTINPLTTRNHDRRENTLPEGLQHHQIIGHIFPSWQDAYLQTHYHLDSPNPADHKYLNSLASLLQNDDISDNDEAGDADDDVENESQAAETKVSPTSSMISPNNVDNYGPFEPIYSKLHPKSRFSAPVHPVHIISQQDGEKIVWNLTRPTIMVPNELINDHETLSLTTSIPHLFPIVTPYSKQPPRESQSRPHNTPKSRHLLRQELNLGPWADRMPSFFPETKSPSFSFSYSPTNPINPTQPEHYSSKYSLLTFQNYSIGWLFDATLHNTNYTNSILKSSSARKLPTKSSSKQPTSPPHARIPIIPRSWGLFSPKTSPCLSQVVQRGHYSPKYREKLGQTKKVASPPQSTSKRSISDNTRTPLRRTPKQRC